MSKNNIEQFKPEEERFWGEKYGKIYPHLEDADPYRDLVDVIRCFIVDRVSGDWLDVGCGSGAMIELLWNLSAGKLKSVKAFDLTETMLDHARGKIKRLNPCPSDGVITIFQHDLSRRLSLADDSCDGVLANLVIPYVTFFEGQEGGGALRGILREMHRVLRPGGIFVWSTPVKNVNFFRVFLASWKNILNPRDPSKLYYGPAVLKHALRIQKLGKRGIYNFFSEEEIKNIMLEVGWREVEIKTSFAGQAHVIKAIK